MFEAESEYLYQKRIEELERIFAHTHEAKYVDGKLTDECNKCGLDIRDKIHISTKYNKEG